MLVPVVTVANRPLVSAPKRVSLPSMFPADWSTFWATAAGMEGLERSSLAIATKRARPTGR